jgi:hypothetical protein
MCLGGISSRAATALRSPLLNSAAFDEANAGVIQLGMTDNLGLVPYRRNEISPFSLNAVSGAPRRNGTQLRAEPVPAAERRLHRHGEWAAVPARAPGASAILLLSRWSFHERPNGLGVSGGEIGRTVCPMCGSECHRYLDIAVLHTQF